MATVGGRQRVNSELVSLLLYRNDVCGVAEHVDDCIEWGGRRAAPLHRRRQRGAAARRVGRVIGRLEVDQELQCTGPTVAVKRPNSA